ncbi:MAG: ribonuclease III family protein [Gemmatimonadaceae bacterium]|nr:ribonuclease III family protein [Gloeobacterales cyanobacterium ES-bin-141]
MNTLDLVLAIELLGLAPAHPYRRLATALTHTSALNENVGLQPGQKQQAKRDYFRLAHLGDALLNAVVTEHLFNLNWGELTKENLHDIRKKICCREALALLASEIGINKACALGQGEGSGNPLAKPALYGEMFEAVAGAVYLDLESDFGRFTDWCLELFLKRRTRELLGSGYLEVDE